MSTDIQKMASALGVDYAQQQLMKQMEQMNQNRQSEQEGVSADGMIKVVINKNRKIQKVMINSNVLKEEKSTLENLLTAAINDALGKADAVETAYYEKCDEETVFMLDNYCGKSA